uniref:Uncharacterized protein n=1 Tax=Avena sativa TaxID=4498 RepID=A0ACD5XP44_AVESA
MESFVPGSNQEMNFVDDSSHPAHPFNKEPQPYDACFAWYTPGSGTRQLLNPVDDVHPPAPTVETNFGNDETTTLHQAFGGFREIAVGIGSLYERVRQGNYTTNDEIIWTLDKLQQIALHHMENIACHEIVYPEPEAPAQPMHNASTSTTRSSDHQSSSRTPAPDTNTTLSSN